MAHEIEKHDSLVLRDKRAWHGLGTIIDEDCSAVDACENYGLGWKVHPWPILTMNPETGELMDVEDHCANVRVVKTPEGDTPNVLGIVGEGYKVCQNIELAEFVDALAQTGEVVIETAGSIRGGKRVWFLARSDSFELPGGDVSHSYLLGSNAHDGSGAIRLDPTDIRVVCANTLRSVVPDAAENRFKPAAISIRHSGELKNKLAEAKRALKEYASIKGQHREIVGKLADTKIERHEALAFFAARYSETFVIPGEGDNWKLKDRRTERMDRAAAAFLVRYDEECSKFGGESAWLALNAWTGYCQHDLTSRGANAAARSENRIRSTLFGVGAQRTSEALADAVATFAAA